MRKCMSPLLSSLLCYMPNNSCRGLKQREIVTKDKLLDEKDRQFLRFMKQENFDIKCAKEETEEKLDEVDEKIAMLQRARKKLKDTKSNKNERKEAKRDIDKQLDQVTVLIHESFTDIRSPHLVTYKEERISGDGPQIAGSIASHHGQTGAISFPFNCAIQGKGTV